MNPENENITENIPENTPDGIIYDGRWEKKERSLTAAAFTALIVIGAIYFNVQSLIATVFMLIYKEIYDFEVSGDFLEVLRQTFDVFKIPFLVIVVISQFVLMLLPVIWIVKRWHTKSVSAYIRLKTVSFSEIILAPLITISFLPFCYYFSYFLNDVFGVPEILNEIGSMIFLASNNSEFIAMIFFVAVTPAICEEIFFRGYFQRTLERTLGWKSFLITGIIFGLFHMQPLSLVALSILGVLFSFFYYRSKSLLPSSISHFVNNFIALALLYFSPGPAGSELITRNDLSPAVVIVSLLISGFLLVLYLKVTGEKNSGAIR